MDTADSVFRERYLYGEYHIRATILEARGKGHL